MKTIIKAMAMLLLSAALVTAAYAAPAVVDVADFADEVFVTENAVLNEDSLSEDGSEAMPYTISDASEFNSYANLIKNNNASYADKYYKLCANIDFTGVTVVPFGTDTAPFQGTLDGDGYALLNVTIPNTYYSGVVGYMTQGTVKNLRVEYPQASTRQNFTTAKKYFGGILGYAAVSSSQTLSITNCEISGGALIHSDGALYAAGVIGAVDCTEGNAEVLNCVTDISFDIVGDGNSYAGGFAAHVSIGSGKKCAFKDCVNYGDINAVITASEVTAGGFCGYVSKDEESWSGWASDEEASLFATDYDFENCVAYGNINVESNKTANVGGFIALKRGYGDLEISKGYKNASQTVEASATNKSVNTTYGTDTTQANLDNPEFYSSELGFDFENKWYASDSKLHIRNVAKSYGAASLSGTKDLRLSSNPGLRFKSDIDVFKRDYGCEYGFIIARADELGSDELTFDYTGKMVTGVAYDATTDIFLDATDDYITFAGVVHSIPESGYGVELVARTYIKFVCDGETVIVYGNAQSSSIHRSAEAIRTSDSYDALTTEQKELLETMLPNA